MAIYEISTYGKQVITNEELINYPLIRVFFTLFTLIFGFIIQYRVLRIFYQLWSQKKRSLIMTTLFIVYLMNNFFHTIHYSDNIFRPVDYYSPKWLYRKYLISTMEMLFIVNIPMMTIGYLCVTQLLSSMVTGEKRKINKYCLCLLLFTCGSLLSLAHYLIEPPFSYQLIPNLTICGEGVMALALILVIIRISYLNKNDMFGGPEKDLAQLLANNNYSDDEEVVAFSKVDIEKTKKRLI